MNTENDPPKLIEGSLYNEVPLPPRGGGDNKTRNSEQSGDNSGRGSSGLAGAVGGAGATGVSGASGATGVNNSASAASRGDAEAESAAAEAAAAQDYQDSDSLSSASAYGADYAGQDYAGQTEIAAGSTRAGAAGFSIADVNDEDKVGFGATSLNTTAMGEQEGPENQENAAWGIPEDSVALGDAEGSSEEDATEDGEEGPEAIKEGSEEEEERKKKRRRTLLTLLALLLLLLLIFVGCRSVFGAGDSSGDSDLTAADVQPVSTEGIVNRIAVSGTIEPEKTETIAAPAAAKVDKLEVAVGDRVEPDQVVATLNTDDLNEQLAEAEKHADAVRKEGDAAVDAAEKEYERLKAEAARGNATIIYGGTEYTLDQARSNPDIEPEALRQALAEANVVDTGVTQKDVDAQAKVVRDTRKNADDADKEAEKAVDKLREQIEDASVKATIAGVVTDIKAKEGQTAEGAMLTVADDSAFKLRGEVKETDIDKVAEGSPVTFTTPVTGEKEFTGEVVSVSPVAGNGPVQEDASSAASSSGGSGAKVTFPVEISVTGDTEGLRMGASARAKILQEIAKDTMTVPAEAVYPSDNGNEVVLVVSRDSRVVEREVQTGETDGYLVAVTGGDLKASDQVILQPFNYQDLEGKKVTVSTGAALVE
ncbi:MULTISPECIES: efflux RND transporter periplasmic adaptor subunit [unclassified Corynebacterium]|uniref:efflux RND transporter periplasmic adaptor subunit n=1 Tax=unclassified Corynebacterium TaxID=2624378 RepID=UPI0029C9DB58|nr:MULTISPECIES: HlyD family efflux transporter periplasmic adaptor subunit [unclassified Corynebacterium]WPF66109.1 efflux RND transporter periplasmic adaptor subunit [Corynebacterium sp. 22KM0430]WPF68601.1 efflux RND transporter periplasmic adaptor subunit [Corynebacterium sp. 21KM1197]